MTQVSPAQRNELFLSSKLRANPQLVSWLLMNASFQKHSQLLDCTLSFPAGPTLKPAEQDLGSFSVTKVILHPWFPWTLLQSTCSLQLPVRLQCMIISTCNLRQILQAGLL